MKLNENWDLTTFSKKSNLKYKIGIQMLYVFHRVTFDVVAEWKRFYIYQYPKFIAEIINKVFTKEVSLAMFVASNW